MGDCILSVQLGSERVNVGVTFQRWTVGTRRGLLGPLAASRAGEGLRRGAGPATTQCPKRAGRTAASWERARRPRSATRTSAVSSN